MPAVCRQMFLIMYYCVKTDCLPDTSGGQSVFQVRLAAHVSNG